MIPKNNPYSPVRGPDGRPLLDPVQCKACRTHIVFIADGPRFHPIEWEGGANHFLRCPHADDFGRPRAPMSYCYKHRLLYHARAVNGCPKCRAVRKAREERERLRTNPPLSMFQEGQE